MSTPHSHALPTTRRELPASRAVLQLDEWPDLTRMPQAVVFDAARICALLAVRPSGAPLVSVLLDLPLERVTQVLKELRLVNASEASPDAASAPRETTPAAGATATEASSLLGRLWQRLSNRQG